MTTGTGRRIDAIAFLRVASATIGSVALVLSAVGLVAAFRDPTVLRTNEVRDLVEGFGVPVEIVMIPGLVVPMVAASVAALFVFLRRPRDPSAMVFALMLVTMSSYSTRGLISTLSTVPQAAPLVHGVTIVAFAAFAYFLLVFPGERFGNRAATFFWFASTVFVAIRPQAAQLLVVRRPPSEMSGIDRFYIAGFAVIFLVLVVVQVTRYLRATGEARLQMKWVMLPLAALGGWVTITMIAPSVFFELSATWFAIATVGAIPLAVAFPICIARAVLKYRLYHIDVIINRALVYGALTALLAALYVGIVFGLQTALAPLARESDIAIAASTLAVAGLFRPLRSRVQALIDRSFYRDKVDAQRTLEDFAARIRDEVDLDALGARLSVVVRDTMHPSHVSLWLRGRP